MNFKFSKIQWMKLGHQLGWLKKADLNPEDQKMMEDIMKAEPVRAKQPSDKLIRDAEIVVQDAMENLLHISHELSDVISGNIAADDNIVNTTSALEEDYRYVMQELPSKPIQFAQGLKEVVNQALFHLDTLTESMNRHNLAKSSLINDIRKDLIFGRRILENIT
jgi:hypothetical protein